MLAISSMPQYDVIRIKRLEKRCLLLPPANEGNDFTPVCDFCTPPGIHPPPGQTASPWQTHPTGMHSCLMKPELQVAIYLARFFLFTSEKTRAQNKHFHLSICLWGSNQGLILHFNAFQSIPDSNGEAELAV